MRLDSLADALVDGAVTVGYAVASLFLTAVGLDAEYQGFTHFGAGDLTLAGWFGLVGVVALAGGLLLARDRLLPRCRRVLA